MTQLNLIGICGLLMIYNAIALQCGPNELETKCAADCETDHCPKNEGPYQKCSTPENCSPGCKCGFDYRRAANGSCIPTEQCPPFECNRPNEVYAPCPPYCSEDCAHATLTGDCPPSFTFILIRLPCSPACRCAKGYWRLNGRCVPYSECPRK